MNLSKEQIQFINQILISNGVVYEDVKLELIDHIASDIEEYIDINDCSFEEAYPIVFEKWKELLRPAKDSIWYLWDFEGPRIVVEKWVSSSKQQMKYLLILTFGFGIFSTAFFQIYHQDSILKIGYYFVQCFFGLYISITLLGAVLIGYLGIKTTYSRLFLRRSNQAYGLPLVIVLGILKAPFFNKLWTLSMNLVGNFIIVGLIISCLFSIKMLFEHFKTVKKYKLI